MLRDAIDHLVLRHRRDDPPVFRLITTDKSSRGFSPTTRYRDFAISRKEFHWETQNSVSAEGDTARCYADHAARGWSIHLFVQPAKGEAFAYVDRFTPRALREL